MRIFHGLLRVDMEMQAANTEHNLYMTMVVIALLLGLFLWNGPMATLMYPVIVSISMAGLLGWSLIYPPSLIERFARLMEPDLDARGVAYTRKVTVVWLCFTLFNAGLALTTVMLNDLHLWMYYNGFISYLLIGLLMGGSTFFAVTIKENTENYNAHNHIYPCTSFIGRKRQQLLASVLGF